jgi:hypothetical protein
LFRLREDNPTIKIPNPALRAKKIFLLLQSSDAARQPSAGQTPVKKNFISPIPFNHYSYDPCHNHRPCFVRQRSTGQNPAQRNLISLTISLMTLAILLAPGIATAQVKDYATDPHLTREVKVF